MDYITEAFKKLNVLNEDSFRVSTNDGIDDLAMFVDENENAKPEIEIIDTDAEDYEDLRDTYIGNVILECPICHSLRYCRPEAIEFSVEDEDKPIAKKIVNRQEECPYCATTNGFAIVGKVMPYEEEGKLDVTVDGEKVEVEEKEEEKIEESLDTTGMSGDDIVETTEEELLDNGIDPSDWRIGHNEDGGCYLTVDSLKELLKIKNESCKMDECGTAEIKESRANRIYFPKDEELNEEFNVKVDTDNQRLEVRQDDATGKVTATAEPITDEMKINEFEGGDEAIAPLDGDDLANLTAEETADVAEEKAENNTGKEELEGEGELDLNLEEPVGEELPEEEAPVEEEETEEKEEVVEESLDNDIDFDIENVKEDKRVDELLDLDLNLDASGQTIGVGLPGGTGISAGGGVPGLGAVGGLMGEGVETVDVEPEEFLEEGFNSLCEKYLKNVYDNVKTFKTTSVGNTKTGIVVEGLIGFNSGNIKKTTFVFEAKDATRSGRLRFVGENKEISRGKKSFVLTGKLDDKKRLVCESLNYNYMQNRVRVNGTVKN